jgi:hypothetical protein
VEKRVNIALDIAAKSNFKNFVFNTKNYQIFSAQRLIHKNQIINIYIEGDGRSWIDRDTISSNPTPTVPFALNLANLDKDNNVIYLARPCQYAFNQKCNESVWTSHQFSKPVLMSYMEVLDAIKEGMSNMGKRPLSCYIQMMKDHSIVKKLLNFIKINISSTS